MKKIISLVLILMIALLCACGSNEAQQENAAVDVDDILRDNSPATEEPEREISLASASYSVSYKNLAEIENASDLVVLVTVLGGSNEIRRNQPNLKEGIHPSSYVLTPVRIDAIYKSDGKYDIGDVVKIEEYYSTAPSATKENTIVVFSSGFYLPMIETHQYILFLKKPQHAGDFEIVRFDLGKYLYNDMVKAAADIKDLSFEELELGIMEGSTKRIQPQYFVIASEIREKYYEK